MNPCHFAILSVFPPLPKVYEKEKKHFSSFLICPFNVVDVVLFWDTCILKYSVDATIKEEPDVEAPDDDDDDEDDDDDDDDDNDDDDDDDDDE